MNRSKWYFAWAGDAAKPLNNAIAVVASRIRMFGKIFMVTCSNPPAQDRFALIWPIVRGELAKCVARGKWRSIDSSVTVVDFYYDVSSPFAYLAAERIGEQLPGAVWRPFSFGVLLRETGRVPWSLNPATRPAGKAEVERRAAERGLPPVKWPGGWPAESYSLLPLRALHCVQTQAEVKTLTRALYRKMFVEGVALDAAEPILTAAADCGLDRGALSAALHGDEAGDRLREATSEALSRGVTGVPTIAVGNELFWGDDRLEDGVARAKRGNM